MKIIRYSGLTAIILWALLASIFFGLISFGLAQDATSEDANLLANDTIDATSTGNAVSSGDGATTAAEESSAAAEETSVQGIWKFALGDNAITMVFNQSGRFIYGLAKSEGDNPWNGAVAGSLSGNAISLSLAAMEGEALASTHISGTVEGDSMRGDFIRSDSSGRATRGEFTATLINPDPSGYTPAAIETVSGPESQTAPVTEQNNAAMPQQSVQETSSKFKDVLQLAKGIDPNIMPRMAPI